MHRTCSWAVTEAQTDTSDNSELDEIELYSDGTKIVFGNGNSKLVYYYSGDEITKYEAYLDYGTAAAAQYAYSIFEKDDSIKNAYVKGKYLVVEYDESLYENLTVSEVRTLYSYLEEVQNNK